MHILAGDTDDDFQYRTDNKVVVFPDAGDAHAFNVVHAVAEREEADARSEAGTGEERAAANVRFEGDKPGCRRFVLREEGEKDCSQC